ncbi:MAG: S8 family serine peptidase [Candidatus Aenigmarchaeota archaeon]|nr:S8 family serine peptidase [Candidatus Aenigmarchaeota archaeon]
MFLTGYGSILVSFLLLASAFSIGAVTYVIDDYRNILNNIDNTNIGTIENILTDTNDNSVIDNTAISDNPGSSNNPDENIINKINPGATISHRPGIGSSAGGSGGGSSSSTTALDANSGAQPQEPHESVIKLSSNMSLENRVPAVFQIFPDDNITTDNVFQMFSCSIADERPAGLGLYIWNSTNNLIYNATKEWPDDNEYFEYNFSYEGVFAWQCFGYDNEVYNQTDNKTITITSLPTTVIENKSNDNNTNENPEAITRLSLPIDHIDYSPNISCSNDTVCISQNSQTGIELKSNYDNIPNDILLSSGQFIPEPGINIGTAKTSGKKHVLVQMKRSLNEQEKEFLKSQGLDLLSYVPNKAWYASIDITKLDNITKLDKILQNNVIRYIGKIEPDYKISPYIKQNRYHEYSLNSDGTVNIIVYFYKDVSMDRANESMKTIGAITKENIMDNALVIRIDKNKIQEIVQLDEVMWVEQAPAPAVSANYYMRQITGADVAQAAPYNLYGSGITAMVYDTGIVDWTHDDFNNRIIGIDIANIDNHATHVAGTLGSNGTLSNGTYKGVAPNISIVSSTTLVFFDIENDYYNAIRDYNISLGSNSIYSVPMSCGQLGDYNSIPKSVDRIVYGNLGKRITAVWSAGNERGDNCGSGYGLIVVPASAKNSITVGSSKSGMLDIINPNIVSGFSSWGPVDDGRIKPDIVAPGDMLYSTLTGDSYGFMAGTSVATPVVAGAAALVYQEFKERYNRREPLPSTIKAVLLHTAIDLRNESYWINDTSEWVRTTEGPDYISGYGRLNITAAIDLIKTDEKDGNTMIIESSVGNSETDEYNFQVNGLNEIKFTLVWDDYPGEPYTIRELVNDIDLVILSPNGQRYYPWTLRQYAPSSAATQDREDNINNVEQVVVNNPESGLWTIRVYGTNVNQGSQNYSLIGVSNISTMLANDLDTGAVWNWESGGNKLWKNWFINCYDDDCAKSGDIGNGQQSWVRMNATGPGILSFYWKVGSEQNYDFLLFCIDNDACTITSGYNSRISGNISWQQKTYNISAGQHSFIWKYAKNIVGSGFADSAWIDRVSFATSYAPSAPMQATGPSTGSINMQYTYTTSSTDPELNLIRYGWDWNNDWIVDEWTGYYTSGSLASASHNWTIASANNIRVIAQDSTGQNSSWSAPLSVIIYGPNNAPNTPGAPIGPLSGYIGTWYTYTSQTNDPNSDQLQYIFYWGDGTSNQCPDSGYVNSSTSCNYSHKWQGIGTYNITVKARDERGTESGISTAAQIIISSASIFMDATDSNINTWSSGGYSSWVVDNTVSSYGTSSVKSGTISDNQESWIEANTTGNKTLFHRKRINSETGHDSIMFYIDNEWQYNASGEQSWSDETYQINNPGTHSFLWRYRKDSAGQSGNDAAWLDRVFYTTRPNKADRPAGPVECYTGEYCFFATQAVDSDNDRVRYEWNWGNTIQQTGYSASGEYINYSHSWPVAGDYNIEARVWDQWGMISNPVWSDALSVRVDRPDIIVTDVFLVQDWIIFYRIRNIGAVSISRNFTNSLYIDSEYKSSTIVSETIAPGQEITHIFPYAGFIGISGEQDEIMIRADINNNVPENNENNNDYTEMWYSRYPVLANISSRGIVKQGDFINITSVSYDPDEDNIRLECGTAANTSDLCTSQYQASNPSCSFNSQWTDNSSHLMHCIVRDNRSRVSDDIINIIISDNAAPITTINAVDENGNYTFGMPTNSSFINISLLCNDANRCSGTQYCIDTANNCSPNITYSGSFQLETNRQSYIRYWSNDTVNNIETTRSQEFSVTRVVNNCATLNISGTYYLTSDIINSTNSTCIYIKNNDITLDCQNHRIDGVNKRGWAMELSTSLNNITIKNCIISNWSTSIVIVAVMSGSTNIIDTVLSSNYTGIFVIGWARNALIRNVTIESGYYGILSLHMSDDHVVNFTAIDSRIINNTIGLDFRGYNNSFSNNLFNNTYNNLPVIGNDWNATKHTGTNIIGGMFIGGNYWAKPDRTGYSETCWDNTGDYICEIPYTIEINNIDFLPLTNNSDMIAPITADNAPSGWQGSVLNINFSCSDNGSGCNYTKYHIDAGQWRIGNSAEISQTGNHSIEYYSSDRAGNNETIRTVYAALDREQPLSSILPNGTQWMSAQIGVSFSIDCIDNHSGCNISEYKIVDSSAVCDSNGLVNQTSNRTITCYNAVCEKKVCYRGIDRVGNIGELKTSELFRIDNRGPNITIHSPITTEYNTTNISLSVGADENIDKWWYRLNNGMNITFAPDITIAAQSGQNVLRIYANDSFGNIGLADVLFSVDIGAPVTRINPNGTNWVNNDVLFALVCSDDSGCRTTQYKTIDAFNQCNDSDLINGTIDTVMCNSVCEKRVCYRSIDIIGNVEALSTSMLFRIDKQPPLTTDNSDAQWHDNDQLIALAANDNGSGVLDTKYCEYNYSDAQCIPAISGTSIYAACSIGNECQKIIRYYSTDSTGNIEAIRESNIIRINKTGPIISITSPENRTYSVESIPLNVFANKAIDRWWYSLNNGQAVMFAPNTTIAAEQGSNQLIVYANDSHGSVANSSVSFYVDSIAPVITIHSPETVSYNTTRILLNVSANEQVDKWRYLLNNNSGIVFVPGVLLDIVNITNHLIVYANDTLGNIGQADIWFNLTDSGADLSIGNAAVIPGEHYNMRFVITNNGIARAENIYWRINISGFGAGYGNNYPMALEPGQRINVYAQLYGFNNTIAPGNYTATISVDLNNSLIERNENDNRRNVVITVV